MKIMWLMGFSAVLAGIGVPSGGVLGVVGVVGVVVVVVPPPVGVLPLALLELDELVEPDPHAHRNSDSTGTRNREILSLIFFATAES
jgi:hypothetical protein